MSDHEIIRKFRNPCAMAFSVGVETLNIRLRKKAMKPVELRVPYTRD